MNRRTALLAFALAGRSTYTPDQPEQAPGTKAPLFVMPPGTGPVYLTIALSGMTALGAEVVWTRLLSLMC